MRACDDLDDGSDPVLLDPGDDAEEAVARRLGDDRPVGRGPAALIKEPAYLLDLDEALATLRALHPQPTLGFPAPQRLHRHAEHLGRLTHPDLGSCAVVH